MDTEGYLSRVHEHFPNLAVNALDLNQDGLVNDVLIINHEWVFRFPKNAWAREMLVHEARILQLVRRYVTLPIPDYAWQADDVVMYRRLPGVGLHREYILGQPDAVQDELAAALATFLHQLHTIPASELAAAQVRAADTVRTRDDWVALYQQVEQELVPLLMTHAREWVARHFAPVLDGSLSLAYEPVLIHGDLGPYHILYDPAVARIVGVLDFGTGGLGDPADDVANIINGLGEGFLRRVVRFYPMIDDLLARARFLAGTLEVQWLLGGLKTGDPSWFAVHLGRARDVGVQSPSSL